MNKDEILSAVTPTIYSQFKTAIEIGKWPDGRVLTSEQKETCMQAIITYEHAYLPKTEHTGFVPPKPTDCGSEPPETDETIKWTSDK